MIKRDLHIKCPMIAALLMFFAVISLVSQPLVHKIEINPLNRAMIYFKTSLPDFTSSLSKDKKQVTVRIPFNGKFRSPISKASNGIIREISLEQVRDSLLVRALFQEPRGYNAYSLPYSGILVIEAFRWNELSRSEDLYRQGLLAYESGVMAEAKSFFEKSAALDHPNANFFCGLLSIIEEEFQDAESYLLKAENLKANIPDMYAALSYIYDMKNDNRKADTYKRKFRSLTGLNEIREIPSNYFSQTDEATEDEPSSLLDQAFLQDSLAADSTKSDSLTKGATIIKTSSDSLTVKTGQPVADNSIVPAWMSSYIFYVIIVGLTFITILIASYIKWRNNKIKYLKLKEKKKKNDGFKDNLMKAEGSIKQGAAKAPRPSAAPKQPAGPASQLTNIYKKVESASKDEETQKQIVSGIKAPEAKTAEKAVEAVDEAPKKERKRESLDEQLEKLANVIETELKREDKSEQIFIEEDEPALPEPPTAPPINPSLQLALHLQEEQEKLRYRNIENLDSAVIPGGDVKKLTEFAKKLGIDKGSVETKLAISKLESNKDQIDMLYKKFVEEKKEKKK